MGEGYQRVFDIFLRESWKLERVSGVLIQGISAICNEMQK